MYLDGLFFYLCCRALRLADRVLFLTGGSTASALWCGAFARAVDAVRDRIVPVCIRHPHQRLHPAPDPRSGRRVRLHPKADGKHHEQ